MYAGGGIISDTTSKSEGGSGKSRGDAGGRTHAIRAQTTLREQILNGQWAAGTRLFEVPLAEALEISRTPVREAMSRLVEEGLLERARHGGFMVRTFSLGDVNDAIELRGVLEGTAARLAAERGVAPDRLATIQAIVSELDECFTDSPDVVDFDRYSELNGAFHSELATLAGSAIVAKEIERAISLPFASPSAFLLYSSGHAAFRRSLTGAQEQHRLLVEAIVAREGTRAEAIAREHARTARRNLDYAMNGDGSLIDQVPGLALIRK